MNLNLRRLFPIRISKLNHAKIQCFIVKTKLVKTIYQKIDKSDKILTDDEAMMRWASYPNYQKCMAAKFSYFFKAIEDTTDKTVH